MKKVFLLLSITALFWLTIDFCLTALNLGPWRINTFVAGQKHDTYHHTLKPNLQRDVAWGNVSAKLCTNEYGFKVSCEDMGKASPKKYDVAFIGDSFTEGVGLPYEDTFVGMYAQKHRDLRVVNLGVSSYSPTVMFVKLRELLKEGFYFKHVIVGIDISDIHDEAVYYMLSADEQKVLDREEAKTAPPIGNTSTIVSKKNFFFEKHFAYTWLVNLMLHQWLQPQLESEAFDTTHLRSLWTHTPEATGYGKLGVAGGIEQAMASMQKIKQLLEAHKIQLSVLVYPWPEQLAQKERKHLGMTLWQEFCQKNMCTHFIDANVPFFDALQETNLLTVLNEYYIRGDMHFNKAGNRLIYETIEKTLP